MMCYLVAKDFNKQGSIAFKTRHGKALAELSKNLTDSTMLKGIQIVTISRPEAYGEYAPYTIIDTEFAFIEQVKQM